MALPASSSYSVDCLSLYRLESPPQAMRYLKQGSGASCIGKGKGEEFHVPADEQVVSKTASQMHRSKVEETIAASFDHLNDIEDSVNYHTAQIKKLQIVRFFGAQEDCRCASTCNAYRNRCLGTPYSGAGVHDYCYQ